MGAEGKGRSRVKATVIVKMLGEGSVKVVIEI